MSGSGKTTLSIEPKRNLIEDDVHVWGSDGIFTLERGCYASALGINVDSHPIIYEATTKFGTILENVTYDRNRLPNFDDDSITKNTCSCFPISFVKHFDHKGIGGNPKNIIFLAIDFLGVLPPVSMLNREQAIYFFLNGYTTKMEGTEGSVVKNMPTFSSCFGAPFMPLHPVVYANMLNEKIEQYKPKIWMLNTGWVGEKKKQVIEYNYHIQDV